MRKLLNSLSRNQDGAAVIEFALWSALFFLGAMSALDFGAFYMQRAQVDEAVSAASVQSFQSRDNVDFSGLQSYVRNIAEDQTLSVTTSCNGVANACTNFARSCACLKKDGTYVGATCGSTCSGTGISSGTIAGYYLTVQASQSFSPVLVPSGVLAGADIKQTATVRLQ